jgi:antitoxin component of MazEF toxin-antitoxin module
MRPLPVACPDRNGVANDASIPRQTATSIGGRFGAPRVGPATSEVCRPAIRVYTSCMKVVKVRRVGNSNVISIPREFEAQGYAPGSSVLVEELPGGELRIMSTEKVRERIHEIGERVVAEHGEALQILADHDPDAPQR